MAPYGIKSVFVPANLLREEIRVGYQAGGDGDSAGANDAADAGDTAVAGDAAEQASEEPVDQGLETFEPAEPDPTADKPADEPVDGPADEPADEAADEPEDEPAEEPSEEPAVEDTGAAEFAEDGAHDVDAALVAPSEDGEMLPNLGGYDEDMEAFDNQNGGGLFSSPDVFNAMRTMLTSSATGASMADLFEDALYETTIIKGHLDSIAQSLAVIAEKYAGRGQPQGGQQQQQGRNQGRNQGRRDRGRNQEREQWNQEPEVPETPPSNDWEDEAAAE